MGLFSPLANVMAAEGRQSLFKQIATLFDLDYGEHADAFSLGWLAAAIAARTSLSHEDAAQLLTGIAADGGPDLRTIKGMACASILLGVPGDPIAPTCH